MEGRRLGEPGWPKALLRFEEGAGAGRRAGEAVLELRSGTALLVEPRRFGASVCPLLRGPG